MPPRARSRFVVGSLPLLFAACSSAPEFTRAPIDGATRERAEVLFARLDCGACHATDALPGEPAPVLAAIGARKSADALRRWLPQSHSPDLLHGDAALAGDLAQFLATLGGPLESARVELDIALLERGRQLFHSVGCVACHAPLESVEDLADTLWSLPAQQALAPIASADLGLLGQATTVEALARFLVDPLAVHPAGRMPSLKLTTEEARGIAAYLLRGEAQLGERRPGWRSEYFEGTFANAADDFAGATALSTQVIDDLSQLPEHRPDDFGFRWSGLVDAPKTGSYEFSTLSDDGSVLRVDGKLVVENDGIHPPQERSGTIWLERGLHALSVSMYEASGGEELSVRWRPPAGEKQVIPAEVLSHWDVTFGARAKPASSDAQAIARGRRAFAELGCVACHALEGVPATTLRAPAFAELGKHAERGCLADATDGAAPRFALDVSQRADLRALVRALPEPAEPVQLARTLERFQCLACHVRDGRGGPNEERRAYFRALVEADLGNEGRLPPKLTGVGRKLYARSITQTLVDGTIERPYLATRMPLFGAANVAELGALFERSDDPEPAPQAAPLDTAQAETGRRLAGQGGLACIQCHVFAGVRSLGIPAVDLTHVAERIKPAWVRQLLLDPQALGMNTRMPIFWDSNGVSAARTMLGGDPRKQVAALQSYLALGRSMPLPPGLLVADAQYELVPETETILCGVFLRGTSPRTLLVGSPELVHYAYDLENSRLVCAWRGQFFNAKGTWDGRAGGLEWPAGADVVEFEKAPALAFLSAADAAWPSAIGREAGFRRLGTRYDAARRPTFRYRLADIEIEESCRPITHDETTRLVRTFELRATHAVEDLYLRAELHPQAPTRLEFSRSADGMFRAHAEVEVSW